jgi:hypothetical protein
MSFYSPGIYLGVANDIKEGDDVGAAGQVLENLDFTLDFLLFDGFENLDAAFFTLDEVNALKHLGIFTASDLADDLVVVLGSIEIGERIYIDGENSC